MNSATCSTKIQFAHSRQQMKPGMRWHGTCLNTLWVLTFARELKRFRHSQWMRSQVKGKFVAQCWRSHTSVWPINGQKMKRPTLSRQFLLNLGMNWARKSAAHQFLVMFLTPLITGTALIPRKRLNAATSHCSMFPWRTR